MATLILTAVGSAIAGPVGGAIGSIAGHYLDRQLLFAPKPRHGPRLGDLAVQTSSYGAAIPRIFGRMRVAGTVIWATDLIESRTTAGAGKGQPKTVSYSYSASFAVALSARPIRSVGRIWAEGKLLRGAAGDFKSATGFRLHRGDEDQAPDPLIVSAEGAEQAPAYRGLAYAVFEQLQLEDFGNRIPSLTFEVEADAAPVTVGAIAEALSEGAITAEATPALIGYAAAGDSIRAAVEAMADVVPLSLSDAGGTLRLSAEPGPAAELALEEASGKREIVRRAAASVASEVSVAYYELERDYQAGLQRATSGGGAGPDRADRRALPAVLDAAGAKALAELRLSALIAGRASANLKLGWSRCALRPGDAVAFAGEAALWQVRRWTLGPMTVDLELLRIAGAPPAPPVSASAGRSIDQPDLPHGATMLRLIDVPLGDPRDGRPLLFALAAGTEPGWRRAGLLASFDLGASWQEAGATAAPATLGTTLSPLPPRGATLLDLASTVEIELLNEAMWLENASDDDLVGGANLALIGAELVQFGRADWLGGRRFRLSRLLRGRRGTEWASHDHGAGEAFAVIAAEAVAAIEAPPGSIGGEARLSASGVGDGGEPAAASRLIEGESLRPPSPAHLRAARAANGDVAIRWVRRSRWGWAWPNGADTPLGEEAEAYRLTIAGDGFSRIVETEVPSHLYSAAEQAADGAAGALTLTVSQLGTYAVSRAAVLRFE